MAGMAGMFDMSRTGLEDDPLVITETLPPPSLQKSMDAHGAALHRVYETGLEPEAPASAWSADIPNRMTARSTSLELAKAAKAAKAIRHSLAFHFKKSAAHHRSMSEHHAEMRDAHASQHEHHIAMAATTDGDVREYHKTSAKFYQAMSQHHADIVTAHSDQAEHCGEMQQSHTQ